MKIERNNNSKHLNHISETNQTLKAKQSNLNVFHQDDLWILHFQPDESSFLNHMVHAFQPEALYMPNTVEFPILIFANKLL